MLGTICARNALQKEPKRRLPHLSNGLRNGCKGGREGFGPG